MADKLAALLAREKSSVAAVGVLHLLGKRGVPELLRAKGIKVERVYRHSTGRGVVPLTWIEHVASPLPRECSTTELQGLIFCDVETHR